MSSRVAPVPLPALAAAAPLDHIEAATIVREVVERVVRGELPGVPSAHVIRLSESGALHVEGPVAADGSEIRRAVQLLQTLLAGADTPRRVPGAMRLVVGRALGTLDLPPYPSLASFVEALSRFAAIDQPECFRRIVINRPDAIATESAVEATAQDVTITVSDIRRARRATGVPLSEISRRSGVPVHLLRQLEWGYLENWPASHVGRRFMASYARAAGLDEQLVMGALWPLLGESVLTRAPLAVDRPSTGEPADIVIEPTVVETTTGTLIRIRPAASRGTNMRRLVAVLTIPALLLIGAAPALWHSAARPPEPPLRSAASVPPPVRQTGVVVAAPMGPAPVLRTGGVVIADASPHASQVPAMKVKRPRSSSAAKAPQVRRNTRAKAPRKWGVWVLDKIGVRIVNDAAVNPQLPNP